MCRLDVCQDGERQEDRDLPTLDVASAHAVAAGDDEEDGEDDWASLPRCLPPTRPSRRAAPSQLGRHVALNGRFRSI